MIALVHYGEGATSLPGPKRHHTSDYSIVGAGIVGGMVRPSALAVLKLMMNFKRAGCSAGRSAILFQASTLAPILNLDA
jgi:hypothetical protein